MSDVLVLGASGNVGAALTRRLAAGGTEVRAFYDPSTPQRATFPDGVQELHGSFDDAAALAAATAGADAVFLLTPPNPAQVAWQRAAIDAAVAAGVARVVKLSAFESGADSPLHMGRWHHDGEVALRASGLEWTILRPQYFMQNLVPAMRAALDGRRVDGRRPRRHAAGGRRRRGHRGSRGRRADAPRAPRRRARADRSGGAELRRHGRGLLPRGRPHDPLPPA